MDFNELNKEMFALQNDFQNYKPVIQAKQAQFPNQQDINFQPIKQNIDTTQIKRPTKSGEQRNDINEKMNMLNSMHFIPENTNPNSPDMLNNQAMNNFQSTRNYSNYVNTMNNANTMNTLQPSQSRSPQIENSNQSNNFANYYNHNFDTLQTNQQQNRQQNRQQNQTNSLDIILQQDEFQNLQENNNHNNNMQNTYTNGIGMLNVRNMYSMNDTTNNKINDTGYHRIEEKKSDYRQNMNNKIDGMIFDNPNALPMNPILQQGMNDNSNGNNYYQKDTRMVIQDSNKDYYRQSSNDRMSQYSPLSRAANIPIHMANMSVNDFYANMNPNMNPTINSGINKQLINEEHNKINSKETLNNRINNYSPLAKTVQYQTNQQQTNKIQTQTLTKPQQWNPTDVNGKLQNVVYSQFPVISNSERV